MLVVDGDLFGATVNLAARLAGEAEPGTIAVTEALVADAVERGLVRVGTSRRTLKNVALPVMVTILRLDCEACAPHWPIDPVCRMRVDPAPGVASVREGRTTWFCSTRCRDRDPLECRG